MPRKKKRATPKGFGSGKKRSQQKEVVTPSNPVQNDKDSGYSTSQLSVLFGMCEGQIEGLEDGWKSIFVDETPLQNVDGSINFKNVRVEFRDGALWQPSITAFGTSAGSETGVNAEVENGFPVTRTINQQGVSEIIVRLGFRMVAYDNQNAAKRTNIHFRIYIQQGTGGFALVYDRSLHAKYSSAVEQQYSFGVDPNQTTHSVRVERVTPTSTSEKLQLQLSLNSIGTKISANLRYPGTAQLALRMDADQLSASSDFRAIVYGLKHIYLPNNASIAGDRGLNYSGTWDGTLTNGLGNACTCPAWCLYDLLQNEYYGLREYVLELNRYTFYAVSQWCNELVPDGRGGTERRFALNVHISGENEATKVLEDMLSVFRGISFWYEQGMSISADQRIDTVSWQFTQADVEDGLFTYNRSGLGSMHSRASVTWNDPDQFYREKTLIVEYPPAAAVYGRRTIDLNAFGCTSQSQARRYGLAWLVGNFIELESVSFKSVVGQSAVPGQKIAILDTHAANKRVGGVITKAISNQITVDSALDVTLPAFISVGREDGVEEYTITSVINSIDPSTGDIIPNVVLCDRTVTAEAGDSWIIGDAVVEPRYYRLISKRQTENPKVIEFLAIPYREDKYNVIDYDYELQIQPPTRQLYPRTVELPSAVLLSGVDQGTERSKRTAIASKQEESASLLVEWGAPTNPEYVRKFIVQISSTTEDYAKQETVDSLQREFTFDNVPNGTYQARVQVMDLLGNHSEWQSSNVYRMSASNMTPLLPDLTGSWEVLDSFNTGTRTVNILHNTTNNQYNVEIIANEDLTFAALGNGTDGVLNSNRLIEGIYASNLYVLEWVGNLDDSDYVDFIFASPTTGIVKYVNRFRNGVPELNLEIGPGMDSPPEPYTSLQLVAVSEIPSTGEKYLVFAHVFHCFHHYMAVIEDGTFAFKRWESYSHPAVIRGSRNHLLVDIIPVLHGAIATRALIFKSQVAGELVVVYEDNNEFFVLSLNSISGPNLANLEYGKGFVDEKYTWNFYMRAQETTGNYAGKVYVCQRYSDGFLQITPLTAGAIHTHWDYFGGINNFTKESQDFYVVFQNNNFSRSEIHVWRMDFKEVSRTYNYQLLDNQTTQWSNFKFLSSHIYGGALLGMFFRTDTDNGSGQYTCYRFYFPLLITSGYHERLNYGLFNENVEVPVFIWRDYYSTIINTFFFIPDPAGMKAVRTIEKVERLIANWVDESIYTLVRAYAPDAQRHEYLYFKNQAGDYFYLRFSAIAFDSYYLTKTNDFIKTKTWTDTGNVTLSQGERLTATNSTGAISITGPTTITSSVDCHYGDYVLVFQNNMDSGEYTGALVRFWIGDHSNGIQVSVYHQAGSNAVLDLEAGGVTQQYIIFRDWLKTRYSIKVSWTAGNLDLYINGDKYTTTAFTNVPTGQGAPYITRTDTAPWSADVRIVEWFYVAETDIPTYDNQFYLLDNKGYPYTNTDDYLTKIKRLPPYVEPTGYLSPNSPITKNNDNGERWIVRQGESFEE